MKIDSRNINDLRADVAANARIFIDLMKAKGYPVGVASTYRNDEQQAYLYEQGRTRPGLKITGSKVTTFHGARLAFDIFQNIKGDKAYNDPAFWAAAREILSAMGFSFLSSEMPHSQWSDGGKYSGSQVRAGTAPRPMPLFKQEEDEDMVRYNKLQDITNLDFRKIVDKLMTAGIIGGDGSDPDGNNDVIDLSHDQVRTLVFTYRGGGFDKKLQEKGLEPAVK